MSELFQVLLLALFPAAGNFLGGLVAEFTRTTRKRLSFALHLSAGILFGVIAIELAPRAFAGAPPLLAAGAFFAGGVFYIGLEALIDRLTESARSRSAKSAADVSGAWVIYAAVVVDLFSDGLLIGTGSAISLGLALVLAIGQVTADIPEGFAAIANFKDKGTPRSRRLLIGASFVVPVLAGALLSYLLLRNQAEAVQLVALAFTAGLLLVAAAEEIIGEAHAAAPDSKRSTLAISGGFVLFALVASYFSAG
ncbi:ZIP family metal transporter [Croceibacterium aestuarii]|uniref:ZIP family metal transporter n=1 Tax=Croceibacterium aestuarii TaxID=3064139 RepID=UPI00272E2F05|nr:peptidoglycan-binding protein [Croceibacterium sp. D39]